MEQVKEYIKQIQDVLSEYDKVILLDDEIAYKLLLPSGKERVKVISIADNLAREIMKIYRTYEFSDRVVYVSQKSNYGTLFNYINSGLLSEEELNQLF